MTPSLFGKPPRKRETRVARLFGGVFFLFIVIASSRGVLFFVAALANGAAIPRPESLPRALGQLTAALILAAPAIWLIASGLPKTLGLYAAQRRTRRRIWYRFIAAGFLVMTFLFRLFAFLGWPAAAGLVNLLFWLGWTWASWIYADRRTEQRFAGTMEQGGVPPITTP